MSETSIHFWDAARPDDEDDGVFSVYVYSDVIPRIGEDVRYWIDYPTHMLDEQEFEEGQPIRITGTVARIEKEYRHMTRGRPKTVVMVSVWLDNYIATPAPTE